MPPSHACSAAQSPLFVTRKFPPSVGGMETLAASVWRILSSARPGAHLISLRLPNRHLAWWLPVTQAKLLALLLRKKTDFVLCGDALTYAVVEPILRAFRVPRATLIMGLDVTYPSRLYNFIVRPALRRAPRVLAISKETAARALNAGVTPSAVTTIRLGLPPPAVELARRPAARGQLCSQYNLPSNAVIVTTVGRLVRRKGVLWFIEHVVPKLPPNMYYFLAGDGPDFEPVQQATSTLGLNDRVHLLGRISEDAKTRLLLASDIFVQPNVAIPGDTEGFGLVTVEAALHGALVIAADLEGIRDAVVDGSTGILLPSGAAARWISQLQELASDRAEIARQGYGFAATATRVFSEEALASDLLSILAPSD